MASAGIALHVRYNLALCVPTSTQYAVLLCLRLASYAQLTLVHQMVHHSNVAVGVSFFFYSILLFPTHNTYIV